MSQASSTKSISLFTIFFTVFLDLLGVGIAIPITAPLLLNPASGMLGIDYSMAARTIILGFLIASFPMASFFGGPLLGALSDRFGRKRLLILSLIGTFIGYLIFAWGIYTQNIVLLFLSRLIDGFTGGNISIIQSTIADVSDEKSKAKNFGLIGMAFGLGFILGPYIGGKLADSNLVSWFSYDTPFLFAALLSAINIGLVIINFKETLTSKTNSVISMFTGFSNIAQAFSGHLKWLFISIFFIALGFNFYTQFFQVFLIKKFQFNQTQIGNYFAFIGLCIALVQGGLVRLASGRLDPRMVLKYGLLGLSFSFLLVLLPQQAWQMYFTVPFIAISQGMSAPNLTYMVSANASASEQGKILGINQSVAALAMALPPILAAFIDLINVNLPIITASFFVLLGWGFLMYFIKKQQHAN